MKKILSLFLVIVVAFTLMAFQTPPGQTPHISHIDCDEVLVVWPDAPAGQEGTMGSLTILRPDTSTVVIAVGPGYYTGPVAKWAAGKSTYYNGPGVYTVTAGTVNGTAVNLLPFAGSEINCGGGGETEDAAILVSDPTCHYKNGVSTWSGSFEVTGAALITFGSEDPVLVSNGSLEFQIVGPATISWSATPGAGYESVTPNAGTVKVGTCKPGKPKEPTVEKPAPPTGGKPSLLMQIWGFIISIVSIIRG